METSLQKWDPRHHAAANRTRFFIDWPTSVSPIAQNRSYQLLYRQSPKIRQLYRHALPRSVDCSVHYNMQERICRKLLPDSPKPNIQLYPGSKSNIHLIQRISQIIFICYISAKLVFKIIYKV